MRTPHGGDQLVGAKRFFLMRMWFKIIRGSVSQKKEETRVGINFLKFSGNDQIILMIVKIILDKL